MACDAVARRGTGAVEGQTWHIGSLRWMQELGMPGPVLPHRWRGISLQREGATVSAMRWRLRKGFDGGRRQAVAEQRLRQGLQVLALLAFGDEPSPARVERWRR